MRARIGVLNGLILTEEGAKTIAAGTQANLNSFKAYWAQNGGNYAAVKLFYDSQ